MLQDITNEATTSQKNLICLDFSNALSHHCTVAWVTRPQRPQGVKDVIMQVRRAAT